MACSEVGTKHRGISLIRKPPLLVQPHCEGAPPTLVEASVIWCICEGIAGQIGLSFRV